MRKFFNHSARIALFATFTCVCMFASLCIAQDGSILIHQPSSPASELPKLSLPQQNESTETIPAPVVTEEVPAPVVAEEVVQSAPPIIYHASRSARRALRCGDTIELVMVTRNPADCCLYEIPLCLPACCVGDPKVDERRGIAGRGVVEYCWECGFTATVKFRERIGDVKVEYDS